MVKLIFSAFVALNVALTLAAPQQAEVGARGDKGAADVQNDGFFDMPKGKGAMSPPTKGFSFASSKGDSMAMKMAMEQVMCPMTSLALAQSNKHSLEMKAALENSQKMVAFVTMQKNQKEAELAECNASLESTTAALAESEGARAECEENLAAANAEIEKQASMIAALEAELAATQNELAAERSAREQLMDTMQMIEESAEKAIADVTEQLEL